MGGAARALARGVTNPSDASANRPHKVAFPPIAVHCFFPKKRRGGGGGGVERPSAHAREHFMAQDRFHFHWLLPTPRTSDSGLPSFPTVSLNAATLFARSLRGPRRCLTHTPGLHPQTPSLTPGCLWTNVLLQARLEAPHAEGVCPHTARGWLEGGCGCLRALAGDGLLEPLGASQASLLTVRPAPGARPSTPTAQPCRHGLRQSTLNCS